MYKKQSITIIALFFLPVILVGLVNYCVDPIQLYRKSAVKNRWLWTNQRYQNAGKINSYLRSDGYDSIIIGNSLSDCFLPEDIEKMPQWNKVLKLTIDGGALSEQTETLKYALKTGAVKNVLIGNRISEWASEHTEQWNRKYSFPKNLYNASIFDDANYLFNTDLFLNSISIATNHRPRNMNARWWKVGPKAPIQMLNYWMGPSKTLRFLNFKSSAVYQSLKEKAEISKEASTFSESTNFPAIEDHVINIVATYPAVNFIFFIAPEPYLTLKSHGKKFYKSLAAIKYLTITLEKYPNASLYAFHDIPELVGNLANYRDPIHYHSGINKWIVEQISNKKHSLASNNVQRYINIVAQNVESCSPHFDYLNAFPMRFSEEQKAYMSEVINRGLAPAIAQH